MEISHLDEACNEGNSAKLLVAKEISPCLLVRFKREYKHAFPYLKNIHVYLHMELDTILCMWWREKICGKQEVLTIFVYNLSQKEEQKKKKQPVIQGDCYQGKSKVLLCKCNRSIVDPGHIDLLDNYEFVMDILVCLPLVEALSSFLDLNLPPFDRDKFPSPVFKPNVMMNG